MLLNRSRAQNYLKTFDFESLFIEELGWDTVDRVTLPFEIDGDYFEVVAIAQKRGFTVYQCILPEIPARPLRVKLDRQLTDYSKSHLLVFGDEGKTQQEWLWLKPEPGKSAKVRSHAYKVSQNPEALLQKLEALMVDFKEEEKLTHVDVAQKVKQGFDVERVTKQFFQDFEGLHQQFCLEIEGIDSEGDRRWYGSVLLNRLMFVYFLQRRYFLDNKDALYLQNKLKICQAEGRNFYEFLKDLFFVGFAEPEYQRDPVIQKRLGKICYLNGGLFLRHTIEQRYPQIQISDRAFAQVFNLFSRYSWHLDDRPEKDPLEINPDVLGYIFEKYINQKEFGAYYTRPEITEYLCDRTINKLVLDRLAPSEDPHPLAPSPKVGEGGQESAATPAPLSHPGRGAGGEGLNLLKDPHPLTPSPKAGEGGQEARADSAPAPLSHPGRGAGGEGLNLLKDPHPLAPSPKAGEGGQEARADSAPAPLSHPGRGAGGEGLNLLKDPHPLAPSPKAGEGGQEARADSAPAPLSHPGRGAGGEGLLSLLETLDVTQCDRLLNEILPTLTLLDPACGSGAFLVAAMKTLIGIYTQVVGRAKYLLEDPHPLTPFPKVGEGEQESAATPAPLSHPGRGAGGEGLNLLEDPHPLTPFPKVGEGEQESAATPAPLSHPGRGAGGEGLNLLEDPHPLTPSPKMGEGEQESAATPAPLSHPGRGAGGEGLNLLEDPHPLTPSPKAGEGGQEEKMYWEISPALRKRMTEVARQFRKEPTPSEAILWQALRGRKLDGRKFKRQQPIGSFIVDFFCGAERLVVEVDGLIHNSQKEQDLERQELLESLGLRFIRIGSHLVEQDLPAALSQIRTAFLPPSPSLGEGQGVRARIAQWLNEAARHPSLEYYIKKRIITDNLYGVDIMEEATEIAKLRLFLALVSSAKTVNDLEPLPNIDFNIMAGNSLIGLIRVDAAGFDRLDAKPARPHPLAPSPKKGEGGQEALANGTPAPLSRPGRGAGGEGLTAETSPHPLTPSPKAGEGGQEALANGTPAPLSRPGRGAGGEGTIAHDPTQINLLSPTVIQGSLLSALAASAYQQILADKNASIELYKKHAFQQDDPELPQETRLLQLRDHIDKLNRESQAKLNQLLLDEFSGNLGIKYEQAQLVGKPQKRLLNIADMDALEPFHWGYHFDKVFARGGFDAIIANPPWETFKPQAKEFFANHSDLVTKNRMDIKSFEKEKKKLLEAPEVAAAWCEYQSKFPHVSAYFRSSEDYRNQISIINGKKAGTDINLYKLFVERCQFLLRNGGRCGIILPTGIYTDLGAKQLREMLFCQCELDHILGLSNERFIFEGVDHRFKFCLLDFTKGQSTKAFQVVFRIDPREAIRPNELGTFLKDESLQLQLPVDLVRQLSPDSLSVMEFKQPIDITIAQKMLQFPLLGEKIEGKWNLKLTAEFHMTNDSHLFKTEPAPGRLPLYEGKMIHQFTHQWGHPKYWLDEAEARAALIKRGEKDLGQTLNYQTYRLGFRDIARNTDQRTAIITMLPKLVFCNHKIPTAIIRDFQENVSCTAELFFCSILNSFLIDYLLRQRITTNLTFFFLYQLPVPRLQEGDRWFTEIVDRAAKLICTTPEFDDLAKEVGLAPKDPHPLAPSPKAGEGGQESSLAPLSPSGRGAGGEGKTYGITNEVDRAKLRAELDGIIAHLYGLTESEFAHILSTFPIVPDPTKQAALNAYRELS